MSGVLVAAAVAVGSLIASAGKRNIAPAPAPAKSGNGLGRTAKSHNGR
jgi:hypothetical protein